MGTLRIKIQIIFIAFCIGKGYCNQIPDSILYNKVLLEKSISLLIQNEINANEERSKIGNQDQNNYVFYLDYKNNSLVLTYGCNYVKEVSQNPSFMDSLGLDANDCTAYNNFCNTNPSNVQNYIIYIDYLNFVIGSRIPENQLNSNQPLQYYWEKRDETDRQDHADIMVGIKSHLPTLEMNSVYAAGKHRILTIAGRFYLKVNGRNKIINSVEYTHRGSDLLTDNVVDSYMNACYYNGPNKANSPRVFLQKTIDYFNNYQQVDPTLNCDQLKASLTQQCAKDYIDLWCPYFTTTTPIPPAQAALKEKIYRVGVYLENYPFLCNENNPQEFFSYSVQEYLDLLNDNPALIYINYIKNFLISHCNETPTEVYAQHFNFLIEYTRNNPNTMIGFDLDELKCLANVYNNLLDEPGFWTSGNVLGVFDDQDYYLFKVLFFAAQRTLLDKSDAENFLNYVKSLNGFMNKLWLAASDKLSDIYAKELVDDINKLVLRASELDTQEKVALKSEGNTYNDMKIPWVPDDNSVTSLLAGEDLVEMSSSYENNGKFKVIFKYCTKATPPYTETRYVGKEALERIINHPAECNEKGVWIVYRNEDIQPPGIKRDLLDAFQSVLITNSNNLSAYVVANGTTPVTAMSGFALAWFIDQNTGTPTWVKVVTIAGSVVALVLIPYAYGPILAAGLAGKVLGGLLITNAVVFNLIEEDDVEDYFSQHVSPSTASEIGSIFSTTKAVLNTVDLTVGLDPGAAVDAIKFLAKTDVSAASKAINSVSDNATIELLSGSAPSLTSLNDELMTVRVNLEASNSNFPIVYAQGRMEALGLNSLDHINDEISDLIIASDALINNTKSGIISKLNSWSKEQVNSLLNDLKNNTAFRDFLAKEGEEAMEAWKSIDDIIPKVVKCLN